MEAVPRVSGQVAPLPRVPALSWARIGLRGALGTAALGGLLLSGLLLAAGAASRSSALVPAGRARFPGWLAGPLADLGVGSRTGTWQIELGVMFVCYLVALACLHALGPRRVWATILLSHLVFLLGPPLFSADVFGYLDFARLGVLHNLDPYTHASLAAPHDAVYPFVGWRHARSPYGPLFTLLTYTLVPLGITAGLWTLKALAAVCSLGAILLVWRAAPWTGQRRMPAVALLGLNPVVLVFAVGGAHNDALVAALVVAAALMIVSSRPGMGALAVLAAVGVKASAGLLLPFAVLGSRRRGRAAAGATIGAVALVVIALVAFGAHAARFLGALRGQQDLVAVHSVPAQVARLLGSPTLGGELRTAFVVGFAAVVAWQLWRTASGADWISAAGWSTLALLASTAWLLPWYVIWVLPLAALRDDRRLRVAAVLFTGYVLLSRMPFAEPLLNAVA